MFEFSEDLRDLLAIPLSADFDVTAEAIAVSSDLTIAWLAGEIDYGTYLDCLEWAGQEEPEEFVVDVEEYVLFLNSL